MGSCISKCCPNPSPTIPQDKLVISQSPATPATNPLPYHFPITQPPSSSSSSSSSSKTSSCSYSSTSTSSKDGSFSNEFLLSCARKNPHIIVLDPREHSSEKPKPTKLAAVQPQRPKPPSTKQPVTKRNQSLPVKRPRSASPPPLITRQKSFRGNGVKTAVPPPPRVMASPTHRHRGPGDARHRPPINVVALPLAAREERLRSSSPSNPSSVRRQGREIHWVHHQESLNGRREVLSKQCPGVPLIEDIDNPLISMDCFIFL